jgi:predicted nucleic acid-binding protein
MNKILIDTCVWSLALRSKAADDPVVSVLKTLIEDGRVAIVGSIRQELLSGYSDLNRHEKLRSKMACFPNEAILDEDYEVAARFSNQCRQQGIQGSHIDFLICAVAVRLNMPILTTDHDFVHYQKYLPLKLFSL